MKTDLNPAETVARALKILSATWRPAGFKLCLGLILSQLVIGLWLDVSGVHAADSVRATLTSNAPNTGSFLTLITPAKDWAYGAAPLLLLSFASILVIYFSMLHVAVDGLRDSPPMPALTALARGFKSAIPGGLVLMALLIPLIGLGQVLVAPAIIVSALALAAPVIMIADRKPAYRALGMAITLRWTRNSGYSPWTVMTNLLVCFGGIFSLLTLVSLGTGWLLELDESLGFNRRLMTYALGDTAITAPYLACVILENVLSMAILSFLPALTAAIYFKVAGQRTYGAA